MGSIYFSNYDAMFHLLLNHSDNFIHHFLSTPLLQTPAFSCAPWEKLSHGLFAAGLTRGAPVPLAITTTASNRTHHGARALAILVTASVGGNFRPKKCPVPI